MSQEGTQHYHIVASIIRFLYPCTNKNNIRILSLANRLSNCLSIQDFTLYNNENIVSFMRKATLHSGGYEQSVQDHTKEYETLVTVMVSEELMGVGPS